MLQRSTIQHLRFPFSFLLMPVFLLSLLQIQTINWTHAISLFIILHLLIYPSSNGYNSYMDKDTQSIGGVEKPMQVTAELFTVSVVMDIIGLVAAAFLGGHILFALLIYVACSRLYSWRRVRIKQYPVLSFLVVVANQGWLIFALTWYACSMPKNYVMPVSGLAAAGLLLAASYPLSQIYQHAQDKADGVRTMSMLLGVKGTFMFAAAAYLLAFICLYFYCTQALFHYQFWIVVIGFSPILILFLKWWMNAQRDAKHINFKNTMQLNLVAAVCANLTFIILLVTRYFG